YFLEVDRGHVSSAEFKRKVRSYERYLSSGLFREIYGTDSFSVAIVTSSETRLRNLSRLVRDASRIPFLFTTFSHLERGLLGSVWQTANGPERITLLPGIE